MNLRCLSFALGLLGASLGLHSWATRVAAMQSATCVGDCGNDGAVTIEEIIRGVNIALGTLPMSDCQAFDASGDGEVTIEELITGVNNALQGCPVISTPTPTKTPGSPTPTPTTTPTMTSELELFDVGANFFSIRKPKGWDIHIAGVCTTLGILIRDPTVPLRQIFYFGHIGPVYLKDAQRQIDQDYINHGGYNFITWLDAPAVDPLTAENFFAHWPDIAAMNAATAYMPQFPTLTGLTWLQDAAVRRCCPTATRRCCAACSWRTASSARGSFSAPRGSSCRSRVCPGAGTAYGSIILGDHRRERRVHRRSRRRWSPASRASP